LISPSGPLPGDRMTRPTAAALEIERLAADEVEAGEFDQLGMGRFAGARRALRVRPEETMLSAGTDEFGSHITIAFTLPSGSFATVLLRELMKTEAAQQEDDDDEIGGSDVINDVVNDD